MVISLKNDHLQQQKLKRFFSNHDNNVRRNIFNRLTRKLSAYNITSNSLVASKDKRSYDILFKLVFDTLYYIYPFFKTSLRQIKHHSCN